MEPQVEEARLLSDHRLLSQKVYHRIGITFITLCFLVGVMYVGYLYYAGPILAEKQSIEASDRLFADLVAKAKPFAFTVVPDALETLTVSNLPPQSTEELQAEFTAARSILPTEAAAEIENIYDLPIGEVTFLEYLNEMPREMQDPFLQMQNEIDRLVLHLNQKHEQKTLAERIGEPNALLYPEAHKFKGTTSVYPSQRVAEAYFIGQTLAIQFPSQAELLHDFIAEYIKSGIAYGHYSNLDATISTMLVDDYIKAATPTESGKLVLQSLE